MSATCATHTLAYAREGSSQQQAFKVGGKWGARIIFIIYIYYRNTKAFFLLYLEQLLVSVTTPSAGELSKGAHSSEGGFLPSYALPQEGGVSGVSGSFLVPGALREHCETFALPACHRGPCVSVCCTGERPNPKAPQNVLSGPLPSHAMKTPWCQGDDLAVRSQSEELGKSAQEEGGQMTQERWPLQGMCGRRLGYTSWSVVAATLGYSCCSPRGWGRDETRSFIFNQMHFSCPDGLRHGEKLSD